jgi:hypothetical protein
MECLISDMDSQVSMIFPHKPPARAVFLCPAQSIGDLPERIKTSSPNFGLLLAIDAKGVKSQEILEAGTKLAEKGLAYLCAWGPDCERVHDLFDEAAQKKNDELTGDDVIMTTWHSGDTLIEALWFFLHGAFPTQSFQASCLDWIIAPIRNRGWEQEVRNKIQEVAFSPPSE